MRLLSIMLLSAILVSCSSPSSNDETTESETEDSVVTLNTNAEVTEEFGPTDSLAAAIRSDIEALDQAVKSNVYSYTIQARYQGYEADSDVTWYFDSLLNLIFSDGTWNMEGSSGNFIYYFDGDNILAARETNYYQEYEEMIWTHKEFKPTFGFSTTDADEQVKYLSEGSYASTNGSAQTDYDKVLNRIREYKDSTSTAGNDVIIEIETVRNYGEDFTERESYIISQELFDKLIKD